MTHRILRAGIDTLEVSFIGQADPMRLDELARLKAAAQAL